MKYLLHLKDIFSDGSVLDHNKTIKEDPITYLEQERSDRIIGGLPGQKYLKDIVLCNILEIRED